MAAQAITRIAFEEWRYWLRSKTGIAAAVVAALLVLTSLITTSVHINSERDAREHLQATAEETFRNQPARHPHRMVHYGHYVFRTPAPLAIADPGVDPYTGTVMFLEGHRQNSATFAPRYTRADAGPYAFLSPALTYQLLVPLLLIVVGFASLAREREARTDQLVFTMAVSPASFWLGKSFALGVLAIATLLPLAAVTVIAWLRGEQASIALAFWFGYAIYLMGWVFLITAASVWSKRASSSLLVLLACWISLCILLPRIAGSTADASQPLNSKVQNDLEITRVLRDVGDSHNASDPAFAKMRAELMNQYGVDSIEELPINFRGFVAEKGEKDLTDILNGFADRRIEQELAQARTASAFSWLSPYVAMRSFSIATASTDLKRYHQFLRDAEAARFAFVQRLNKVHTNDLSYTDDINRNKDEESGLRARVDAHHWQMLDNFKQMPKTSSERLASGLPYLAALLLWAFVAAVLGLMGSARAAWKLNG